MRKHLSWYQDIAIYHQLSRQRMWCDMGISVPLRTVKRPKIDYNFGRITRFGSITVLGHRGTKLLQLCIVGAPVLLTIWVCSFFNEMPMLQRVFWSALAGILDIILLASTIYWLSYREIIEVTDRVMTTKSGSWLQQKVQEMSLDEFKGIAFTSLSLRRWWGRRQTIYQIFLTHQSRPSEDVRLYCGTNQSEYRERLAIYPELLRRPLIRKRRRFSRT